MVKRLPSRVLCGSQVELSILPLVGQYLAPDGTLFPIATLLDAEKILLSGQWRKHLQPGYWRAARKCKVAPYVKYG